MNRNSNETFVFNISPNWRKIIGYRDDELESSDFQIYTIFINKNKRYQIWIGENNSNIRYWVCTGDYSNLNEDYKYEMAKALIKRNMHKWLNIWYEASIENYI